MNGQMRAFNQTKYRESCSLTGEPQQREPLSVDLQAIIKYAHDIGKEVFELSDEEKKKFITRY